MDNYTINNAIDGIHNVQIRMVSEMQNINKNSNKLIEMAEQIESYCKIIKLSAND